MFKPNPSGYVSILKSSRVHKPNSGDIDTNVNLGPAKKSKTSDGASNKETSTPPISMATIQTASAPVAASRSMSTVSIIQKAPTPVTITQMNPPVVTTRQALSSRKVQSTIMTRAGMKKEAKASMMLHQLKPTPGIPVKVTVMSGHDKQQVTITPIRKKPVAVMPVHEKQRISITKNLLHPVVPSGRKAVRPVYPIEQVEPLLNKTNVASSGPIIITTPRIPVSAAISAVPNVVNAAKRSWKRQRKVTPAQRKNKRKVPFTNRQPVLKLPRTGLMSNTSTSIDWQSIETNRNSQGKVTASVSQSVTSKGKLAVNITTPAVLSSATNLNTNSQLVQKPVTPAAIPGRSVTPAAIPGRSVTPAAIPGRSVTPAAIPGRSVTPAAIPGRSVTPAAIPGRSVIAARISGSGSSTPGRKTVEVSLSLYKTLLAAGEIPELAMNPEAFQSKVVVNSTPITANPDTSNSNTTTSANITVSSTKVATISSGSTAALTNNTATSIDNTVISTGNIATSTIIATSANTSTSNNSSPTTNTTASTSNSAASTDNTATSIGNTATSTSSNETAITNTAASISNTATSTSSNETAITNTTASINSTATSTDSIAISATNTTAPVNQLVLYRAPLRKRPSKRRSYTTASRPSSSSISVVNKSTGQHLPPSGGSQGPQERFFTIEKAGQQVIYDLSRDSNCSPKHEVPAASAGSGLENAAQCVGYTESDAADMDYSDSGDTPFESNQEPSESYRKALKNTARAKKVRLLKADKSVVLEPNGRIKFKCTECNYTSDKRRNLSKHAKRHKAAQFFSCGTCNFKTESRKELKTHILCHTMNGPHACTQCPLKFHKESDLANHIKYLHEENCISCPLCQFDGKSFDVSAISKPSDASVISKLFNVSAINKPSDASAISKPSDASVISKLFNASAINKPSDASAINKPSDASAINKPSDASAHPV